MKEIEVLHELLDSVSDANLRIRTYIASLVDGSLTNIAESRVIDTYYFSPSTHMFEPKDGRLDGCLRTRVENSTCTLTTKSDVFDESGVWKYSNETSVQVTNQVDCSSILKAIGFEVLVTIDNRRTHYQFHPFEITIESVDGLGNFIEVETLLPLSSTEDECAEAKLKAKNLLTSLKINVGQELNAGKPELMLRKLSKNT